MLKNKSLWTSIAVFGILALIFAFSDLAISENFATPQSKWAYFMEAYGQLPGMLIAFLGSNILLRLMRLEKTFKSITSTIDLFILTAFMGIIFWVNALGQQVGQEVDYLLVLGLSIVLLITIQVWFHRIPDENMQEYKVFGQIAISLFFLAGVITVWGIKIPWGRWTFRDMMKFGDLSLYTPWYLPQGNNGHHSFFSGHTALAFCVLPVVLFFRKNKTQYTIAWILVMLWGGIMAISRVKIGAHFPSDVLFGGGQTILWFWLLKKKFLKE